MYKYDDRGKGLLDYYSVKAKDPGGGKYFRVTVEGRLYGTIWGRSLNDAINFIRKQYREENEQRNRLGINPVEDIKVVALA